MVVLRIGGHVQRLTGINGSRYLFPVSDSMQGALNIEAYWEFAAQNRRRARTSGGNCHIARRSKINSRRLQRRPSRGRKT
jgi:hypothetical protein